MIREAAIKYFLAYYESAGFFFVPTLLLLAFFNLKSLRKNPGSRWFVIISLLMLTAYLLLGADSSRYLMIPLLLCGILSGAGGELLTQLWREKHPRLETAFLLILAVIAMGCSVLKLTGHGRNVSVKDFAEKIRAVPTSRPIFLYSADSGSASKLTGLLQSRPNFDFIHCVNWQEAMDDFTSRQREDKDFYFITRVRRTYSAEDFKNNFRGKYYIYPFDLVLEKTEHKYNYILLKFNGKTLDGQQRRPYFDILEHLPDTLPVTTLWQSWQAANIETALPELVAANAIFVPNYGSFANGNILFRNATYRDEPQNCSVKLYNAVHWPSDFRSFQLQKSGKLEPVILNDPQNKYPRQYLNQDPPLVIPFDRIVLPDTVKDLYLPNAVPIYHAASQRIKFSTGEKSWTLTNASQQSVKVTVADQYLKTSSKLAFNIRRYPIEDLKKQDLSILLIEDKISKNMQIKNYLPDFLSAKSQIDVINLVPIAEANLVEKNFPELPAEKKYDLVILNDLHDPLYRPWTVPVMTDQFIRKHFDAAVEKIRRSWPDVPILIVMPPTPPEGQTLYLTVNAEQFMRLDHYSLGRALYRWQQQDQISGVTVAPLFMLIHPEQDFIIRARSKNQLTYSGYSFYPHFLKLYSEAVGAAIIDIFENRSRSPKQEN